LVGYGEDRPEEVKPKRVEEFKVHPYLGMVLIPEGELQKVKWSM